MRLRDIAADAFGLLCIFGTFYALSLIGYAIR